MKLLEPPVKVGIVGYGYAGRAFHSYLVSLAEGLELYAIATRDPQRREQAAQDQGVKTFETLEQMLDDPQVQLVVIATPHDTHRDLAVTALRAGRHVVVDKVMALKASEADDMIRASRESGTLLSVFHNRRWDGDYLTVRKALESGLLGEPRLLEVGVYTYVTPRTWRGRRAQMGGILYDWGAHFADQVLRLFPDRLVSVGGFSQFLHPESDIESFARCQMKFEGGLVCSIEVSNQARLGKHHWYVVGSKGALIKDGLDPQEAAMNQKQIERAREDPANRAQVRTELHGQVVDMVLDTIPGNWKAYYQNIAEVLTKGAELAVKPEQVRQVVSVLEAQVKAAETGCEIPASALP